MKTREDYLRPWKDCAKNYGALYSEPGLPSPEERKIFNQFLKSAITEKSNVLVLGATPSIRDEVARFDCDITLIDMNKTMIDAMTKLITHDKEETKVNADWLDMPFTDNSFDIVIGDLVIGNVDAENEPKFFKEIKRVMKPGGNFITRVFFVPDDWKILSTEQILKNYSYTDDTKEKNTELFMHFLYNSYDPARNEIYSAKVKEVWEKFWNGQEYVHQNKRVENILNSAYKMWGPFKKIWRVGTKDELFNWVSDDFEIIKETAANDHFFAKSFPVIICKPKNRLD